MNLDPKVIRATRRANERDETAIRLYASMLAADATWLADQVVGGPRAVNLAYERCEALARAAVLATSAMLNVLAEEG